MSAGVSERVRRTSPELSADASRQARGLLLCRHQRFPSARAEGVLSESIHTRGPIKSLRHMWRPCPGSKCCEVASRHARVKVFMALQSLVETPWRK